MTVAATVRKAGPFSGSGTTGPFPFTFKVFAAADLVVLKTDPSAVDTTLALTTDYTVSLNADQDANPGGSVTTIATVDSGYKLTITSAMAADQQVKVTAAGGFDPTVFNNEFDKLTILVQQGMEKQSRSPSWSASVTGISLTLPAPVAGQFLAWDASGTSIINASVMPAVTVSSWVQSNFLTVASQAAALAAVGGVSSAAGSVATANLADGAVTTAKLADANVTAAKLKDAGLELLQNKIINGCFRVDQRNAGAAQTFTAAAALAYCADHWYGFCTGANVTGQRVTVSGAYRYRFTGAASVTGVGLGQRIESLNSFDLAGRSATLQVKLSSTSLTSIGWALYYANSADTFGSLASPTRTLISSGTFTINTTEAVYSATVSIPGAATTGLELVLTGGALLAAQTLTVGDVDLRAGTQAFPFAMRSFAAELALCERYYTKTFPLGTAPAQNTGSTAGALSVVGQAAALFGTWWKFPTRMRGVPTITRYAHNAATSNWSGGQTSASQAEGEYGALIYSTTNGAASTAYQIHATAEIEIP